MSVDMYYVLKTQSNPDNNQIAPQVEDMGPGYNWQSPASVTHLSANVPLAQPPNLQAFHLDQRTAITDVISQAYIRTRGLLVSPEFVRIVERYHVQHHERYPAEIVLRGRTWRYFWLHMIESAEDSLDYSKCEFSVEPIGGAVGEPVSIVSKEVLAATVKSLIETMEGELTPRRLTFAPGSSMEDLFCLDLPMRTFFVSPRLRDALSNAHLTGFEIAPIDLEVVTL